ncbi:TadE/TadG family type IV pilus assembly protein [Sphingomicrobium lutaoense]|uniref:Flp pilus assembly protein TadG n=1 Tax=Sphingomicrobium lutaoense TaxID=515949 RepID=A0A839Z219_9SPHN|nr:TadE/TadG family type IV pilus assembly protein [Sphingomicrobium lutaoense]MBB3764690.1 Flp pilus assembly protein TadG [Sphingomicrobium lutaoense]
MIHALLRDRNGASAAEFALLLPLLMILTLGTIDAGRYMWEVNEAKKATQYGARWAIVTDPVEGALITENFVDKSVGGVTLTQGDNIPAAALGTITCTNVSCTCTGACLASASAYNGAAFNALVQRMQLMDPRITPAQVRVSYSGSGLGFAGDPNGPDISPIVTVSLSGKTFTPVTTFLLATVTMPDFRTSLTAEDLSGSDSN